MGFGGSDDQLDEPRDLPRTPHRWTPEEDAKLICAVKWYNERDWARVAEAVGTRNHYQCRQRWTNIVKPAIFPGKRPWTKQEDALLRAFAREHCQDLTSLDTMVIDVDLPVRTQRERRHRLLTLALEWMQAEQTEADARSSLANPPVAPAQVGHQVHG
mmetsp:Transcript_15973/g.50069  ORF Transcript_15973/g.50069 Transcript_15973/m.50069 type:complete len:158 (-) Transcript_15973:332-805(-)